jgi:hypothetical protein
MDKLKISLDWECWASKPSTVLQYNEEVDKYGNPRTQAKVIGARLGSHIQEVGPKDLARHIAMGKTWSPFTFKECPDWGRPRRLEGLFDQCQVLAVDFDNGDSVEEVIGKARSFGLEFTLVHHSFSSTPDHPKLRGVFFLDQPIVKFDEARDLSAGLAYLLGGDRQCVDVARMYYGSTPESIVSLNQDQVLKIADLKKVTKGVEIPKTKIVQLNKSKEDDDSWGDMEAQRASWSRLSKSQRAFVLAKLNGVRRDINEFQGQEGRSRYECVWRNTSRLARMPELLGSTVYDLVMDCVSNNAYFNDWDKSPDTVIRSAIEWSFSHADERVISGGR